MIKTKITQVNRILEFLIQTAIGKKHVLTVNFCHETYFYIYLQNLFGI